MKAQFHSERDTVESIRARISEPETINPNNPMNTNETEFKQVIEALKKRTLDSEPNGRSKPKEELWLHVFKTEYGDGTSKTIMRMAPPTTWAKAAAFKADEAVAEFEGRFGTNRIKVGETQNP